MKVVNFVDKYQDMKRINKEKLIAYLRKNNGKPEGKTWLELAKKFNIRSGGSKSQRTKAANDIWRNFKKVLKNKRRKNPVKILCFDIETSPLQAYVWRLWNQNVHPLNGMLQGQHMMLCWSAKWLFEEEVMSMAMTPKEVKQEDDARVTVGLWKLLDEADIVVAHYGDGFDIPTANTRFLLHGLPSPSPYISIDTKKHASRHFKFESNKLDYIARILGLGAKLHTDFSLWKGCMDGNKESLRYMSEYCDMDVKVLEDVYIKLRPFIKPHPNLGLFTDDTISRCPTCGSADLEDAGTYRTYVNEFKAHRCIDCGSISRERKSITPKDKKKSLLSSTPK